MNLFEFFIPLLLTFFILKNLLTFFRTYFPAIPTNRGMHQKIKANSGGIIFVLIYIFFSIYKSFYIPLISLPLSVIGLLDDKFNLSSKSRFIAQIITVIITIIIINNFSNSFLNNFLEANFIYYIIFTFIGVAIINFINFMDGIDGLVCSSFIIILFFLNSSSNLIIPLIGSLVGFLKFNWQSSKIFMGDSGSLFLGSFFVGLLYSSNSSDDFIKILLLVTPLIIDPIITIIRRFLSGQNFLKPHKLHLYQRLVSNGFSHSTVSIIYIGSIAILGIFYSLSNLLYLSIVSIIIIISGIFIDINFAKKFNSDIN